jgi:FkbM family methyltransferase
MPDRMSFSPAHARLMWAQRRLAGDASLVLVDELVREGDVVVDAGAERGMFTARLAQLVGPKGAVHAFEPNPDSLAYLQAIAAAEPNVRVHGVALSDRTGEARLYVPVVGGEPVAAVGSLAPPEQATCAEVAIETTRLDDALEQDAARVSFVKCDVEGHELAALRGAARTLAESRPLLLVEIERRHSGERMDETFAYLSGLGYEGFAVGPEGPLPLADFDVERDQLAFLGDTFETGAMPPGYIHDFLFASRGDGAELGEGGLDARVGDRVRVALARSREGPRGQAGRERLVLEERD